MLFGCFVKRFTVRYTYHEILSEYIYQYMEDQSRDLQSLKLFPVVMNMFCDTTQSKYFKILFTIVFCSFYLNTI